MTTAVSPMKWTPTRKRFFRSIDRAVLDDHSRPTGLPLILAALAEHQARFHGVSHNPFLLAEGITVNPDAMLLNRVRTFRSKPPFTEQSNAMGPGTSSASAPSFVDPKPGSRIDGCASHA